MSKKLLLAILVVLVALTPTGRQTERATAQNAPGEASAKPNILFILTDDQDADTMYRAMPNTVRLIAQKGATFQNATYAFPLCCPSRASILRGQYPHNTGVYGNAPPNGGYETFRSRDLEKDTFGTTIDAAGYETGLIGKVMNGFGGRSKTTVEPSIMPGWDTFFASTEFTTLSRFVSRSGKVRNFPDNTHDAVVAAHGMQFLQNNVPAEQPWMLYLNYYSPHYPEDGPASYQSRFATVRMPRPPSYNERDVSDKPRWLQEEPRLSAEVQQEHTEAYRDRLRASAYIDEQNRRMIEYLHDQRELQNTYVIYYSDNGFHLGEHRLPDLSTGGPGGKISPYIEDARFPILMRGPGIPAGARRDSMVQNVDIRPTVENIANASTPAYVDGASMLDAASTGEAFPRQFAYAENLIQDPTYIPGYKAVYTPTEAYHLWDSGEEEYYDLVADPHQLESDPTDVRATRLRDALAVMEDCEGGGCTESPPSDVSSSRRSRPHAD